MADIKKSTDGPQPGSIDGFDLALLPDAERQFISEEDLEAFAAALSAPEILPGEDPLASPSSAITRSGSQTFRRESSVFITAQNDWSPVHQKISRRKSRPPGYRDDKPSPRPNASVKRKPKRGRDETREGFVYALLKWPLLVMVFGWIAVLGIGYLLTRLYIFLYENLVTWRGKRLKLKRNLGKAQTYQDWIVAAKELDTYLGNQEWKTADDYAYYDYKTVRRVRNDMMLLRRKLTQQPSDRKGLRIDVPKAVDDLRVLVEACLKNNFVGTENSRLYSQTYYGTKNLVQSFNNELAKSLEALLETPHLTKETKRSFFKHTQGNFGRTALCLSGGACFAYYHFGVVKALIDANLLPQVITGTSGGALVAALVATRTDEELKQLLVPALAHKITACHDEFYVWMMRWWKTGARFDSIDWARRCSWFSRGSLTFREAYQRTGRILNVTCVPSDPHSPTILTNYLTAPDCVIWSAVLASAAVPGILNPVVLMKKSRDGTLAPYSFGHKWKDGSLRTDIPLKALNLHFNVNFSIVSQVNPHVNLFFFSSRGSVGRPVTHRKGRGWRGGFLGSATEQYLKLDLTKWLKVLRHLELLPRLMGQDWSSIWLQRFDGTITIWPKTIPSDFVYILSDPTPQRLARMIRVGQQSTFPKLMFIANRLKIEKLIGQGRDATRPHFRRDSILDFLSEDDVESLMRHGSGENGTDDHSELTSADESVIETDDELLVTMKEKGDFGDGPEIHEANGTEASTTD